MRPIIRALPLVLLALGYTGQAHAWDFRLQCVPFARAISGIRLFGDAWRWWSEAAGRYERGQRPQPGSVLSFRPNTHMPLGHVAVVTRVVSARRIEIDHANWASPGEITTGAAAVDVSERNDWSAVRVELGRSERFGSVYTTDGFIYVRGRPGSFADQTMLMYVGRALAAARQAPRYNTPMTATTASTSSATKPLLPWNPIPIAPPLTGFSTQPAPSPIGARPAHGRVL